MLRRIFGKKHLICGGLIPVINTDEKKLEEFQKLRGVYLESGWERVKVIFKENLGSFHPDLQRSLDVAEVGLYLGGLWGGIIGSREGLESFKNNNDTTLFHNKEDAYVQASRKSLLDGAKRAIKMGPLFAAFTGGFTLFTSCVQAYTLKQGLLEYCMGGFMIGSLLRIHYGIRGMIVGGVVASLLGGIYGAVELSLFKILRKDPAEVKFLIASYKMDVADSISSTYFGNSETPAFTVSEPVSKSSHTSDENRKTEKET